MMRLHYFFSILRHRVPDLPCSIGQDAAVASSRTSVIRDNNFGNEFQNVGSSLIIQKDGIEYNRNTSLLYGKKNPTKSQ